MARFDPTLEACFPVTLLTCFISVQLNRLTPSMAGPPIANVNARESLSTMPSDLPILELMTPTSRDAMKDPALPDDTLREPLDSLSIELTRISAEIQSINSGFQAQMQQVVGLVRETIENEYRARMEKSIAAIREKLRNEIEDEIRKDFDAELRARTAHLGDVENEIARVLAQIEAVTKEIAAMLDDPSIELARVMRKRTEQAELKAYLNGLRFSAGGQSKAKTSGA